MILSLPWVIWVQCDCKAVYLILKPDKAIIPFGFQHHGLSQANQLVVFSGLCQ